MLAALNDCDETPGDVLYTSIWSEMDEIIMPQTGSMLRGANNIELDGFVEHGLIFLVDQSFGYLRAALLNGTGLNTDGPGWNCIDYCIPPDPPDDPAQPETVEAAEGVMADDVHVAIDDASAEVSGPDAAGDAAAADAFGTDTPPDADTGGLTPARDAMADADAIYDSTVAETSIDGGRDTGAAAATGGCSAGPGGALPVAVLLAVFSMTCAMGGRVARRRR